MHPEVGPVGGDERLAEVVQGGVAGVLDVPFLEHDPIRPAALRPVDGTDAAALATHADLRLLVHLDLGDHPAGRRIQPGEVDAGGLADQAASSVAADEVLRSERRAVGQLDIDAGVVLREAHHLAATKDRHPELVDPAGQDALEVALPQREPVVVAGGEVADVQAGSRRTPATCIDLARREEPVGDATLIEHLDGAGVQTPGSRSVELLAGASFDDDDVDPRQRQLARQHQPGRAAAGDHHRMLGHRRSPANGHRTVQRSRSTLCRRQRTHSTTPGSRGSGRDRLSERVMVSTFGSFAASPLPRAYVVYGGGGSRSTVERSTLSQQSGRRRSFHQCHGQRSRCKRRLIDVAFDTSRGGGVVRRREISAGRVENSISAPSQCERGQRGRRHTRRTPWPSTCCSSTTEARRRP